MGLEVSFRFWFWSWSLLLTTTLASSCIPVIDIPTDARLRCAEDRDCPRETRCIDDDDDGFGICLGESPCLTQGSLDVVADGTPCGNADEGDAVEICVDGACAAPSCGDGVVDFAGGELCDPRRETRCRADCTPSACGDGIIDAAVGETCDAQRASCVDCAVMCLGTLEGQPASFSEVDADCNLEPSDGCECAPRRYGIERPNERIVQQGALVGDTLYLVTVDAALAQQGQLSFRLERATLGTGAGEPLQRVTLFDDAVLIDLTNTPGDDEVFALVALVGSNEVHRLRGAGAASDDVVVHAATAQGNAVGRIAIDAENVYGAGLDGVRVFARDGDGSVNDDVLLPSETCRDGGTGKLVSCGAVVACFGQLDGNIVTIDKAAGAETLIDHVDVVPSQLGGAANTQTLFCKDDRLHWHDRAGVYALDDDGERTLVAQLPSLVRTVAGVENAAAFGNDILIAGVTQATFRPVVVRVDLVRRTSTVVLPGGYLTHDDNRIVGSANLQGEIVVLDVTGEP